MINGGYGAHGFSENERFSNRPEDGFRTFGKYFPIFFYKIKFLAVKPHRLQNQNKIGLHLLKSFFKLPLYFSLKMQIFCLKLLKIKYDGKNTFNNFLLYSL